MWPWCSATSPNRRTATKKSRQQKVRRPKQRNAYSTIPVVDIEVGQQTMQYHDSRCLMSFITCCILSAAGCLVLFIVLLLFEPDSSAHSTTTTSTEPLNIIPSSPMPPTPVELFQIREEPPPPPSKPPMLPPPSAPAYPEPVSPPPPRIPPSPSSPPAPLGPAFLTRCSGGAARVAECLNQRFRLAGPYYDGEYRSDPALAGVLVSQFDVHHQGEKPWLPSSPDWDIGDHFTGTMKNAAMQPGLWSLGLPGFVVAPTATKIFCSYSADGTTQGDLKSCRRRHHVPAPPDCVPGCNLDFQSIWCDPSECNADRCNAYPNPTQHISIQSVTQPGRTITSDCAWPAASLKWMLKQQALRRRSYNEVVFDSIPIVAGFPHSLEAFFLPVEATNDPNMLSFAEASHRAFLAEYSIEAEDVPLLLWHSSGGGKGLAGDPFGIK